MIKGRIYVIYNTVDNQECIGSTTTSLKTRWRHYRNAHNNPKCKSDYNMKICKLMREYGWDKFDVKLIEEIECVNKRELEYHEYNWMDTMEDAGYHLTNSNRGLGFDSRMDYYRANPESHQKYLARQREKWKNDPESRERDKARKREKYHNDPEYRQKNLDKKKEKISCPDCGKMMCRVNIPRHRKSCKNFDICLI